MGDVKLPAGALAEVRRAIEETATKDGVRALREAGRRLAADAEYAISQRDGPLSDLPMDRFWLALGHYFQAFGWGRIEHQEVHEGLGAVLAHDWAEADPNEARAAPGCHISTGLLAEILSRVAGRPVAVMEVDCRSQGDDYCRFLFGSPTTLLRVHRKLAHVDNLDDALTAS